MILCVTSMPDSKERIIFPEDDVRYNFKNHELCTNAWRAWKSKGSELLSSGEWSEGTNISALRIPQNLENFMNNHCCDVFEGAHRGTVCV